MNQEGLNFEILNKIQDRLTPHMASLDVLSHLIAVSVEGGLIEEDISLGLSTFIFEWIEKHNTIIDEALKEVESNPDYVLHRAGEFIHLIRKGARIEADRIKEIIEKLENVIETYGGLYRPEAESLLEELKGIQEKRISKK